MEQLLISLKKTKNASVFPRVLYLYKTCTNQWIEACYLNKNSENVFISMNNVVREVWDLCSENDLLTQIITQKICLFL